jgi:hypothetical protein
MKLSVRAAFCVAFVCAAATPLRAVAQSATLTGIVRDASGASVQGVTVVAASESHIGGPALGTTDERGQYRITGLSAGSYTVSVAVAGFTTAAQSDVRLTPGLVATLDFALTVAGVAQSTSIAAFSPLIPVKSSAIETLFGREWLENLPIGKSIAELVNLVPGVLNDAAFGGTRFANVVSLDGTSANEPGWGTAFVVPYLNWMEEVQVVSLGAAADQGEFSGARLAAVVRSGTNAFSGLGEFWGSVPGWTGNNRGSLPPNLAERFKPLEIIERWDGSAQVGGPIKRDRLWFFTGLAREQWGQRVASFALVPRTPDEPLFAMRQTKSIIKLSAAATAALRVHGFYEHDNSTLTGLFASPVTRPEALGRGTNPQRVWNLRASWSLSDSTLLEAHHGGHRSRTTTDPVPPGSLEGPPPRVDAVTGVISGNIPSYAYGDYRPLSFSVSATHYRDGLLGVSHTLKSGIEHERAALSSGTGYPGGRLYREALGVPTQVEIWPGAVYRPRQRRTTIYLQDLWQATPRVAVNGGLRVTFNSGSVPTRGTVLTTSTLSPRIGIAVDVDAQHRTVIRGHYGHYHDPFVTSFYDFLDPLSQTPYVIAIAVGPDQFVEQPAADPTRRSIDPRLRHSYAAEALIGIEREMFRDVALKVHYVRRDFRSIIAFTDPTSVYEPLSRVDRGADGITGSADDGTFTVYNNIDPSRASLLLTNPPDAFRHYQALQVTTTKRFSRGWQMQASYTWSRTYGNAHNTMFSNAANNVTGTLGVFSDPNRAINAESVSVLDVPHELKALGSYRTPWFGGVNVSGVYRYATGRAFGRLVNVAQLPQGAASVRVEPVGARRLEGPHTVDLRVEKAFPFGGSRRARIFADVLNVGNQGVPTVVNEQTGPNFGVPNGWRAPRTIRLGARLMF